MKKASSLILVFVLCLSLCACGTNKNPSDLTGTTESTHNDESIAPTETTIAYTEELVFSPTADLKAYAVTGIQGIPSSTDIVIPEAYEGIPVTTIAKEAFKGCSGLTNVTYQGTIAQWYSIEGNSQGLLSSFCDITCSDGTIPKSN